MSMITEFKEFALKGNVMDLAVGVIIGGAFSTITTSLVEDIIMPIVAFIVGGEINFQNMFVVLGDIPEGEGVANTYEALKEAGVPIPDIFERDGEEGFRKLEKEITKKFSRETGVVISTGGGIILDNENYDPLKQNGYIVLIDRSLHKLSTKGRPLSKGGIKKLKELKKERESKYLEFSDIKIKNTYVPKTVDKILEAFDENSCN